ncbi:type VII toxin-antitoxin system HepT family RNase toxin [Candidatus Thiodictyon syntrophicum]|jgi:uncharacterized protein YutE (UPF0331/DUF86 family)|uniref:DUF86 domain-containing protein n=1 Tax=Candidatus Thiodictyon syntrophicum TaxID=1166950 RepID=A0A2K8U296_9GAMM|nr:HepT-like ribonuclease domain-containing protein [Candidatus Thiodictyon syntrophicum]AUB79706.1 hypothetical protein THSYN_01190 [Candidatus Thiodictyon syntrophicum]
MTAAKLEVIERKRAFFRQYLHDLAVYGALDAAGRRREHYAIERLLQLLCESAADLSLQVLKASGQVPPGSYREIFSALSDLGAMPGAMAAELIAACGMRNLLTHLYDVIDLGRVIAAVEPALALYRTYDAWLSDYLAPAAGPSAPPRD